MSRVVPVAGSISKISDPFVPTRILVPSALMHTERTRGTAEPHASIEQLDSSFSAPAIIVSNILRWVTAR